MPIDYEYTEAHDLKIENGDFVRTESTTQHQQDLLYMKKGSNSLFLFVGVGIREMLLNDEAGDVLGEIQKQFRLDGMEVQDIDITGEGKLKVRAYYEIDRS